MKKHLFTVAMAITLLATGCTGGGDKVKTETDTNSTSTEQQAVEVKEMAGADLEAMQDDKKAKENYLVIDVRPVEEYQAGHLPHAINVLSDDIVADPSILSDYKDKAIVTYCNTGKRSLAAAEALVGAGYTDVTNAEGVKNYEYKNLITYSNVTGKQLEEIAQAGGVTIIDARDAKDYEAGHLPGAINVLPGESANNLDKIPQGTPVYTYCYTGNKSGQVAQELIDAGYTDVYNSIDGTKEYEFTLVTE